MEGFSRAIARGPQRRRREGLEPFADGEEPSVLVVDAESLIRWSLSETLRDRGMHVATASDGKSALDLVAGRAHPFDVVLLDCHLPNVSEWPLLHVLLEMSPTSAIVVMTAFPTTEMEAEALRLGASAVLRKPFELEDVTNLVRELVESDA